MPNDIPPALVASADQAYAESSSELDIMVGALRDDMLDRPGTDDALYWVSTLRYMSKLLRSTGGITDELLSVYISAIYRLARQQVKDAP